MNIRQHHDLSPQEWLAAADNDFAIDQELRHPNSEFEALRERATNRLRLEHDVLESLSQLRRVIGLNQTEIAQRWGRSQSQVSKLERSPANAELATLAGYVRALGGTLTMTIEADGHFYHEELVASENAPTFAKVVPTGKKSETPKASSKNGRKQNPPRAKDGAWRAKRSDASTAKSKKK
jgi:transcriptional regulator with XRE-family HTH domain